MPWRGGVFLSGSRGLRRCAVELVERDHVREDLGWEIRTGPAELMSFGADVLDADGISTPGAGRVLRG